ncbi:unnamed protein product [Thlaspi arvense]|uniref:CASP-like protein n=1 Tax=Thlaspi arvense TaxID=13288 RepID=A0AAU9SAD7_THLAR|nr:unnamed protein product [Thlaspi arvense]
MKSPGKPMSPSPTDTSMAIVTFDKSTTQYSSSPSPPHSLDHSSESEKDEKRTPESRRNKIPAKEEAKAEETRSPIVVVHSHSHSHNQNPSVKEFSPPVATTRKSARVGSGRSSGQRSGAVSAILRRSKREEVVKFAALGFRLGEFVLALISFSVMAADRTKGWSGDSFDRYKEYRFCLSVNVVAFVYSAFQACDLAYHLLLAYLLISASTAAVTRVDDWVTNWGKDDFTEMASASIAMSFLAFFAFACSSLISGSNLFNQDSL